MERMAAVAIDTISRLLTGLAVRLHAFALCEIRPGFRLGFDPMDAVTIHYVLSGEGTVRTGDGGAGGGGGSGPGIDYRRFCMVIVPAGTAQSLGQGDAAAEEPATARNCNTEAGGLVRFTAGGGSGPDGAPPGAASDQLVLCATITASYAGALGLFDGLRAPIVEDWERHDTMRALFAALLAEIERPGIGSQALLEALLKQCLILLLRRHLDGSDVASPLFAVLGEPRLSRAIFAVIERPDVPYTVERLASVAGMSRSSFAERFSRLFGRTPMQFVGDVRLRLGADLLRSTDLPVKVVAASAGFSQPAYFSRAFREAHGVDPSTFRARTARDLASLHLATRPSLVDRLVGAMTEAADGPA